MSKVKTTETIDATETLAASMTVTTNKKIGVVRYLQINPQSTYISSLMKKKYKMEYHTIEEWDEILANLLGTKTN